jgi:hypothetical protein
MPERMHAGIFRVALLIENPHRGPCWLQAARHNVGKPLRVSIGGREYKSKRSDRALEPPLLQSTDDDRRLANLPVLFGFDPWGRLAIRAAIKALWLVSRCRLLRFRATIPIGSGPVYSWKCASILNA